MTSWYTIRARAPGAAAERAEISIYDEIGANGVSAKGFLAELGALPDEVPIDLRLNSPGGSVFDAVAIHNALQRHAGAVTVWIDGIAASAASYIAMAGDEIVMPENAFLMIHDPAGLVMGTAADMREMAGTLDKIAGSMVRGYAARSGRSEAEIEALMAAETWFDASDALAAGLATRIAARHAARRSAASGCAASGCAASGCAASRSRHGDRLQRFRAVQDERRVHEEQRLLGHGCAWPTFATLVGAREVEDAQ